MCLHLTNAFIILPSSHLLDLRFTPPPYANPWKRKNKKEKNHRQKHNKSREATTVFSPCLCKWWVSQCSRGCKSLPGDGDPSSRRKAAPAPCTCRSVFCFRMLSLGTARYTGRVMLCVDADYTVWINSMILHSHLQTLTIFKHTFFTRNCIFCLCIPWL